MKYFRLFEKFKSRNNVRSILLPLTPHYEPENHFLYFDAINLALNHENKNKIKNIALTGNYGVGKSSILQKLAEKYSKKVVQISLSTLALSNDPKNVSSSSGQVLSTTNLIQKEIVKQLLYCEEPTKTPGSRFNRIGKIKLWRELWIASLSGLIISFVFFLMGWTKPLTPVTQNYFGSDKYAHIVVFIVVVLFTLNLKFLFHNRIRVDKISLGATTISLSQGSTSFFDQYLDEIVYFFEVTGRNIVIFEDIDRFDDPHIFETLRALNTLLNGAKQLSKRNICFIYAIKDSVFEKISKKEENNYAAETELTQANRTKFFDLIIPVVPFITHRNSRDLMSKIMKETNSTKRNSSLKVSKKLIDIVSAHITDMRMIKNIHNEFVIFQKKLIPKYGEGIGLKYDYLFAMVVYKNIHVSDFETVSKGTSNLDKLYRQSREIVTQNITSLDIEANEIKQQLQEIESLRLRSEKLGKKLVTHINKITQNKEATSKKWSAYLADIKLQEEEVYTPNFWKKYSSSDRDLVVKFKIRNSKNNKYINFSYQNLAKDINDPFILYEADEILDENKLLKSSDSFALSNKLKIINENRDFLLTADMSDLLTRDDFMLTTQNGNKKSFQQLADEQLSSKLAKQLITAGYINRNFTLYTSIYHSEIVTLRAINFIIHNVEPNLMDMHFYLEDKDVESLIKEYEGNIFHERCMYNVSIFDNLLEKDRPEIYTLIESLKKYGKDEQKILQAYFSRNFRTKQFTRLLTGLWNRIFVFLAFEANLHSKKNDLINLALKNIDTNIHYLVKGDFDDLQYYFENNYHILSAITTDKIGFRIALSITKLFAAAEVKISSLALLSKDMKYCIIKENLYTLTRDNLILALENEKNLLINEEKVFALKNENSLALDTISKLSSNVYKHVLNNLSKYLNEIPPAGEADYIIQDASLFQNILEDVLASGSSQLSAVVALSSSACKISELNTISKETWATLAEHDRFPTTFQNIKSYVNEIGTIDTPLANHITKNGIIDVPELETEEDAKNNIAKLILQAANLIPDPQVRTKLAANLNLNQWLPASLFVAEAGQLIGLLIENNIVADKVETFSEILSNSWETYEFAISKSKEFVTFMTPNQMPPEHVSRFMRSTIISPAIKLVVCERLTEFVPNEDQAALKAVAEYANDNKIELSLENIFRLTDLKLDAQLVLRLLTPHLPEISETDLVFVLNQIGSGYANLTVRNGKRPKIPRTDTNIVLVEKLKQLEMVSSYKIENQSIVAHMKKSS